MDPFHQWFALLKFGHGRCTANAAREVREGFITRDEAVALVHKYDTEFPSLYFKEFLESIIGCPVKIGPPALENGHERSWDPKIL